MISRIVTHLRPHADELVALMLLRTFKQGEEFFPGIMQAKLEYMATGLISEGKTTLDFPDTVFLGCGGGIFDEHSTFKTDHKIGSCCTTLVAEKLGVLKEKGLERILFQVLREDEVGAKVKHEIPSIIKLLHNKYPNEPEKVATWTVEAYEAVYKHDLLNKIYVQEPITFEHVFSILQKQNSAKAIEWKSIGDGAIDYQNQRFQEAGIYFNTHAQIENLNIPEIGNIKIASIITDNEETNRAARFKGVSVLIQFNTRGNCAIFTDYKKKLDLTNTFVMLRLAEQSYRGSVEIKDTHLLSKEGFTEGIPYWFLFHTRQMGFNGSLTTSDIPPTMIPHEKIINIVKQGLLTKFQ